MNYLNGGNIPACALAPEKHPRTTRNPPPRFFLLVLQGIFGLPNRIQCPILYGSNWHYLFLVARSRSCRRWCSKASWTGIYIFYTLQSLLPIWYKWGQTMIFLAHLVIWTSIQLTFKNALSEAAVNKLGGIAFRNLASHAQPSSRPCKLRTPGISVCQMIHIYK